MNTANYWIEKLQMQKHPEGGYFKETYRAEASIPQIGLPSNFKGARSFATGIYFLLTDEAFSAFHRIESDEMWHFYAGDGIEICYLDASKQLQTIRLGQDFEAGEQFQAIVPAHCWFASHITKPNGYALVGCTVSPGFDFEDFEMAKRADLIQEYPEYQAIIVALTRI